MKKKRFLRGFGMILLLLLLGVAGIVLFWEKLPYQSAAEGQIKRALAAYGLEVSSLRVDRLTAGEAVLTDIRLGKDKSLSAGRVVAEYDLRELQHAKLRSLALSQVQIQLYQQDGKWRVAGLESLPVSETPGGTLDGDSIRALLPEKLSITEGTLTVTTKDWALTLPFEASADGTGKTTLNVAKAEATGLPWTLPPLGIRAEGMLAKEATEWNVTVTGPDGVGGAGIIRVPFADPLKGMANIKRGQFPWGGGMISAEPFTLPFAMNQPIRLTMNFKEVLLAPLLDQASSGKVQATGKMSGRLPVVYHMGGRIEVEEGAAEGLEKGTITVAPELIPGDDQAQLEMLRAALKNFQYTSLKISVSSNAEQKSTIRLALEGSNPEAFNGRQVNLNVNLNGDILPLIQQSLMPIQDIRTLLKPKE